MRVSIFLLLVAWAAALQHMPVSGVVRGSQLTTPAVQWQRVANGRSVMALRGGAAGSVIGTQWARYIRALDEHPLRTKMATGAVLASIGDLIAQAMEGATSLALRRLVNLVLVNVLYVTPFLCATYALNEWLVGKKVGLSAASATGTGARLIFDQFVNAPVVVLGFFCSFGLIDAISATLFAAEPFNLGLLGSSIAMKLRTEYVGTMINNWKIWIAPQLVNFALMPPPLRVPFASVVALVWNVVLALVANR